MRLTTKVLAVCGGAVVVSCLIVGFVLMRATLQDLEQVYRASAEQRALLIAEAASDFPIDTLREVVVPGSPVLSVTLYDEQHEIIATRSQPQFGTAPPSGEMVAGIAAQGSGVTDYELDGELFLSVAQVEDDDDLRHVGVIVSKAEIDATMTEATRAGFVTTMALALVALLLAAWVVRRITKPVAAVTQAAADLENGNYDAGTLADAASRSDEVGTLARRFSTMAEEVQARERRLADQVSALQVRIDEAERRRSVERITGTESFAELAGRAQRMRARRAAQEHPDCGDADEAPSHPSDTEPR